MIQKLPAGNGFCKLIISLVLLAFWSAANATTVILQTTLGDIEIELFEEEAPVTAQNFLNYVHDGDFQESFIHRSIPGFIIQGGGYTFTDDTVFLVPADDPIINEFGRSNLRGTIAMAKLDGDPNSATSGWFINLADNSENLDNQNGGFTVFGQVIGDGMAVADAIAGLQVWNAGGPFDNLPLINYSSDVDIAKHHLVTVNAVDGGIPFNPGLNGSWANFDTLGQGFFIDVLPDIPLIFLAWFTWETDQAAPAQFQSIQQSSGSKLQAVVGDDNHRWMTAQGGFSGSTATLDVTLTTGGLFDNPQAVANSEQGSQGTIKIIFNDCSNGIVRYDFSAAGLSGEVPIRRLADDNAGICEALIAEGE